MSKPDVAYTREPEYSHRCFPIALVDRLSKRRKSSGHS